MGMEWKHARGTLVTYCGGKKKAMAYGQKWRPTDERNENGENGRIEGRKEEKQNKIKGQLADGHDYLIQQKLLNSSSMRTTSPPSSLGDTTVRRTNSSGLDEHLPRLPSPSSTDSSCRHLVNTRDNPSKIVLIVYFYRFSPSVWFREGIFESVEMWPIIDQKKSLRASRNPSDTVFRLNNTVNDAWRGQQQRW